MNDKELREAVEVLKIYKEAGIVDQYKLEQSCDVVLSFCEQVLSGDGKMPERCVARTTNSISNAYDNGFNECYDIFLSYLAKQVLSAEMPTRATTLGAEDNKADINGWNACYDAFIAYLAHKKLGQEEKVKGLRNKIQAIVGNTFLTDQILKEIMEVV